MSVETATATPRSPVSCTVEARGLRVVQDKPESSGGTNEGMMSSELLLAGLLACQLSTFYKVARKRDKDVQAISLRGDLHFDDAGDIRNVELTWTLSDDDGVDTLLRLTDRVCTISRALSVPVSWSYEVSSTSSR